MDDRLASRGFSWQEMIEPEWANVHYTKPDFQAISYYSAPKA
jgi:Fe-S cluster assembly protein SufB